MRWPPRDGTLSECEELLANSRNHLSGMFMIGWYLNRIASTQFLSAQTMHHNYSRIEDPESMSGHMSMCLRVQDSVQSTHLLFLSLGNIWSTPKRNFSTPRSHCISECSLGPEHQELCVVLLGWWELGCNQSKAVLTGGFSNWTIVSRTSRAPQECASPKHH